jgi:hypothetical protein
MEIPVYLLDESNTYSDFTKVMQNIMGIEELRDPLGSRMNRPVDDDYMSDEYANHFGSSE